MSSPSSIPNEALDLDLDDLSSLRAALSVIDDWDIDFGDLFESELTPAPPHEPQRPMRSAPYTGRNRRKLEIQALREQSAALERELERAVTATESKESGESAQLAAAREQLALNQRTQRDAAEDENADLRELLKLKAKTEQRLLNASRRVHIPGGLLPPVTAITSFNFDWQRLTTAEHLAEVNALYDDMPRVFSHASFISGSRDFQEIQVLKDGANGNLIKFDIAVVLPFDVERVAEAMWHHTVRMSSDQRVYDFKDLDNQESSLVSLFAAVTKQAATFEGCMQGQIATRRYVNGTAHELVCKIYADLLADTGVPFAMVVEGWLRCVPIHRGVACANEDCTTSPLTQVFWHRRIHVHWATESSSAVEMLLTPEAMATHAANNTMAPKRPMLDDCVPDFDASSSLRAALSVIDDWDIDFGFLFEPEIPTSAPLPPVTKADKTRRFVRTPSSCSPSSSASKTTSCTPYTGRNRRKLEILALREQAASLQRQLDRAQRAADTAANEVPTPESELSKQLTVAWEQFAVDQRAQRETLEDENGKLRESVAVLAKLARQMFNTSRRARAPPGLLPDASLDDVNFDWQTLTTAAHLTQLDTLYADMTTVFDQPCFAFGKREFQEIQTLEDASGHVVTFDIGVVLPFDVHRVADALWHHTIRMSSNERVYQFKDLETHEDSSVSLFAGVSKVNCFEGCMQGQIATRRYAVGETREIVSKVVADVLMASGAPFVMSGEGWLRCTPLHRGVPRTNGEGMTSPLTQVHWHRRIRVQSASDSSASMGTFLTPDDMTSRVRETVAWNLQSVENHLLTQTRRKHLLHAFEKMTSSGTMV